MNESLSRSPKYLNPSYNSKSGVNAFGNANTLKNNRDSDTKTYQKTDHSTGLVLKNKNDPSNQNLLTKFSRKVIHNLGQVGRGATNAGAKRGMREQRSLAHAKSVDILGRRQGMPINQRGMNRKRGFPPNLRWVLLRDITFMCRCCG